MWHKTYRHCSHAWLEDVCKLLRHNSYCKWAIEATMVWRTSANKTPWLSSVIVVSCCVQTNSPCHVKNMGIVHMHEWKMPLGYWGWDMQKWAFVYLGHTKVDIYVCVVLGLGYA